MSLPFFPELGNTPKVENEDPLLVNPLVELCAGFVSKLNVSIFNYTAQTPGQGNQLLHCYKKAILIPLPVGKLHIKPTCRYRNFFDTETFFPPPTTECFPFAQAAKSSGP